MPNKQSRTMETPKEYYYTYYSYEEWGRGYFGSRKCYCLPEEDVKYLGSSKDKTFKPKYKIILKDDYKTREEALADEIILHDYYDVANNHHFANKAKQTSTKFCYKPSREEAIKLGKKYGRLAGKKSAQVQKINKTGLYGLTNEQRSENGKKSGKKSYKKAKEFGIGICGLTSEQIKERNKKATQKSKELGVGIFGITPEQRTEYNKKGASIVNAQKWMCLETGYITTAGALGNYQKARGIDPSKRVRVE